MTRIVAGTHWSKDLLENVPKNGGVYLLYQTLKEEKICSYIGMANNLRKRISEHERLFDCFSFIVITHTNRKLLEDFMKSAMHPLPSEVLKLEPVNEKLIPMGPEVFLSPREDPEKLSTKRHFGD